MSSVLPADANLFALHETCGIKHAKKVRWWHAVLAMLLSGDCNPIHWWPPYARKIKLPSVIAHGFVSFAFLSAAFARRLPGVQVTVITELKFIRPLFYGDTLTVSFVFTKSRGKYQWYSVLGKNQSEEKIIQGAVMVVIP